MLALGVRTRANNIARSLVSRRRHPSGAPACSIRATVEPFPMVAIAIRWNDAQRSVASFPPHLVWHPPGPARTVPVRCAESENPTQPKRHKAPHHALLGPALTLSRSQWDHIKINFSQPPSPGAHAHGLAGGIGATTPARTTHAGHDRNRRDAHPPGKRSGLRSDVKWFPYLLERKVWQDLYEEIISTSVLALAGRMLCITPPWWAGTLHCAWQANELMSISEAESVMATSVLLGKRVAFCLVRRKQPQGWAGLGGKSLVCNLDGVIPEQ